MDSAIEYIYNAADSNSLSKRPCVDCGHKTSHNNIYADEHDNEVLTPVCWPCASGYFRLETKEW